MGIRLRYTITVTASSTSAEEKDLGNIQINVVSDGLAKGGLFKTLLPAGTPMTQIYLDNIVTNKFLFIRTTSKDPTQLPVTVNIAKNSAVGEVTPIAPLPATNSTSVREGHLLMSTDGITSLWAANPGTVDMELTVGMGGDIAS